MSYTQVPLENFAEEFATTIELSSAALGGSIVSVSDEFFAEAFHLLLVEPAPSLKGQFGPKGALFSGWESRRHNPTYDWCIIKLGTAGNVFGFDVDTAHFNGNEAPQVSIQAAYYAEGTVPKQDDPEWLEILPKVDLGPSSRHLFKIPATTSVNYVKLNMYPDGGIARFRVYGLVTPILPTQFDALFDLAHVFSGGRVVYTSDQHFGVGSNLILPGRGKDMGDGWETKRSRQPGHKDWTILKLAGAGYLSHVEIDTAHFMGNFPESCEIHATHSEGLIPTDVTEEGWALILSRAKLGPHRQHQFQLENTEKPYTHVRVTIYPDGGIKRVRVFGRLLPCTSSDQPEVTSIEPQTIPNGEAIPSPQTFSPSSAAIPALALTSEGFKPFGQVIQAYADLNAVPNPRNTKITGANQGTAVKFHKLALLESSYPSAADASSGISVYRCQPIVLEADRRWPVKVLERHSCTNQTFIPMGAGLKTNDSLDNTSGRYLVIVAHNGEDDKPDLKTLRAFVASASQGIVYNTGIWHHPMAVLDGPMDLACVETQIGDGNLLDCEIVTLEDQETVSVVQLLD
ncbi:hypothetical protein QCA50_009678 [Cerrena zonata]|uniref:Allantoicase domain-containing protein n=1 Tax=Cerrena zonata TaxID=2478898 RepID=A0AAW0GAI6_9APHY